MITCSARQELVLGSQQLVQCPVVGSHCPPRPLSGTRRPENQALRDSSAMRLLQPGPSSFGGPFSALNLSAFEADFPLLTLDRLRGRPENQSAPRKYRRSFCLFLRAPSLMKGAQARNRRRRLVSFVWGGAFGLHTTAMMRNQMHKSPALGTLYCSVRNLQFFCFDSATLHS